MIYPPQFIINSLIVAIALARSSGLAAQQTEAATFETPTETLATTETPVPQNAANEAAIKQALSMFTGEPSLEELKLAALIFADADRMSTMNWQKTPRRSALLPTFKFTAEQDFERDERLDRYQDQPDRWGADTDRDLGFLLSAEWKLNHLVYSPEEVKVHRILSERSRRREAVLSLLIGYFFERRRLMVESVLIPPQNTRELIGVHMRIEELTASIDSLTGGLLSRSIKRTETTSTTR